MRQKIGVKKLHTPEPVEQMCSPLNLLNRSAHPWTCWTDLLSAHPWTCWANVLTLGPVEQACSPLTEPVEQICLSLNLMNYSAHPWTCWTDLLTPLICLTDLLNPEPVEPICSPMNGCAQPSTCWWDLHSLEPDEWMCSALFLFNKSAHPWKTHHGTCLTKFLIPKPAEHICSTWTCWTDVCSAHPCACWTNKSVLFNKPAV